MDWKTDEEREIKNSLKNYKFSKKAFEAIDSQSPRTLCEDYYYNSLKSEVEKCEQFIHTVEKNFDKETLELTKARYFDTKSFSELSTLSHKSEQTLKKKMGKVVTVVLEKLKKGGDDDD